MLKMKYQKREIKKKYHIYNCIQKKKIPQTTYLRMIIKEMRKTYITKTTLMKETGEDTNGETYSASSWTGRTNIVKMFIPPKTIHRFYKLYQNLMAFSQEIE